MFNDYWFTHHGPPGHTWMLVVGTDITRRGGGGSLAKQKLTPEENRCVPPPPPTTSIHLFDHLKGEGNDWGPLSVTEKLICSIISAQPPQPPLLSHSLSSVLYCVLDNEGHHQCCKIYWFSQAEHFSQHISGGEREVTTRKDNSRPPWPPAGRQGSRAWCRPRRSSPRSGCWSRTASGSECAGLIRIINIRYLLLSHKENV